MVHTYSLLPDLFSYASLSPVILRLILGLVLLNLGWLKLHQEKNGWIMFMRAMNVPKPRLVISTFGIIEIIGGLMFMAGLYTQSIALVFILLGAIQLFIESKEESLLRRDVVFYLLITAISLSLLLTGPGMYAIDLPL